jgi:TolB-like protein
MRHLRSLLLALALVGCASVDVYEAETGPALMLAANYRAADALAAIAGGQLDPERPILIATVVDIDNLEQSSTLGRFLAESVSSRFTHNRYRMVEMKLQGSVYMRRGEGELMLTRQVRDIANAHQAQAVVVGTYSRASGAVFVNLKVVKPENNIVIAAQDYSLPMSRNVCVMLNRNLHACPEAR